MTPASPAANGCKSATPDCLASPSPPCCSGKRSAPKRSALQGGRAQGEIGHPGLPHRRRQPYRHVRPQAGRPAGDSRRVQADRHEDARPADRASTCRAWPPAPRNTRWSAPCRTSDNNHLVSTHHVLTGHPMPGAFFDKVASRDDWPSYSAGLDYLRPRQDGVPSGVNLPTFLMQGPLTWPGQHAGFLGAKHDPWQITADLNVRDFRVDGLSLAPGLEVPPPAGPPGAARPRQSAAEAVRGHGRGPAAV